MNHKSKVFDIFPVSKKEILVDGREYPSYVYALKDDKTRVKLVDVCESLGKYAKEVRFGVHGPTMEIIGEMLEATG